MKIGFQKKREIEHVLGNNYHLRPIYEHVLDIPGRVHEYDPMLFLVFNVKNGRYEIHSLDGGETSYNATLPYRHLDERTLRYIRKNDIKVHGMKIYERIEKSEREHEKRKEREQKQFTRDFASEFQSEFAKDAWLV